MLALWIGCTARVTKSHALCDRGGDGALYHLRFGLLRDRSERGSMQCRRCQQQDAVAFDLRSCAEGFPL